VGECNQAQGLPLAEGIPLVRFKVGGSVGYPTSTYPPLKEG
jgi:hypothetical protein